MLRSLALLFPPMFGLSLHDFVTDGVEVVDHLPDLHPIELVTHVSRANRCAAL